MRSDVYNLKKKKFSPVNRDKRPPDVCQLASEEACIYGARRVSANGKATSLDGVLTPFRRARSGSAARDTGPRESDTEVHSATATYEEVITRLWLSPRCMSIIFSIRLASRSLNSREAARLSVEQSRIETRVSCTHVRRLSIPQGR